MIELKLGKKEAVYDSNTFRMAGLLSAGFMPTVPASYQYPDKGMIPVPMFGNAQYGCCVIAARAHHLMRMEYSEHKKVFPVTEKAVLKEYFKQTGGSDDGLVMLDSIKLWRNRGWYPTTGASNLFRKPLKIHAFASIDPMHPPDVKAAIYLLTGVQMGLSLPLTAQAQFEEGSPWMVEQGCDAKPGSWGGHAVAVIGYSKSGCLCTTWGQKQWMTWGFVAEYCDECYAIVDEAEILTGEVQAGINVPKLESYLEKLKKS